MSTGNAKLVELVLDHGADIDETTGYGSVVNQAIQAGREDVIALLLSRNADINLANSPIKNPLISAVRQKNERLIRELLKRGAETGIMNDQLYEAASKLLPQSCRTLLANWKEHLYEDQVRVIRDSSSDAGEKESALVEALAKAVKHQQPEVHRIFIELAEEFNVARPEEYGSQ